MLYAYLNELTVVYILGFFCSY